MSDQILIPLLSALAAMLIGGAVLLARWSRRIPMQERLRKLEQGATATTTKDAGPDSRLQDMVALVGAAIRGVGISNTKATRVAAPNN